MKKAAVILFAVLAVLCQGFAKDGVTRVLAIGNSFSWDSVEQNLYQIAAADSVPMIIGNMYIGGCSIDRHVKNIQENIPDYRYCKITADGTKTHTGKFTLADWTNGWHLILNKVSGDVSYFPATTRYDGQYALLMGSMVGLWGNYWYNATSEEEGGLAYALSFNIKEYGSPNYSIMISPLSSGSRADAFAIRCIKE